MRVFIQLSVMALACLLGAAPLFAEVKTFIHTVKQPFGGSQSPDDARIAAVTRVKREVLEQAGTYMESLTVVKDHVMAKDEILALAAGVLKLKIVSQENYTTKDGFGIIVTAKVDVDTSILEKRVEKLLQDRPLLEKYKKLKNHENELLARIETLEEQNRELDLFSSEEKKQEKVKLNKQFRAVSKELVAFKWKEKAVALWKEGEYTDPGQALEYLNHAIRINPNDSDAYINRGFAYANLGELNSMCSDFRRACELGDCAALLSIKKSGDCR